MDILQSDWFFSMLARESDPPSVRLKNVFRIASQWIQAPGIRDQFELPTAPPARLKAYLTETARLAKVEQPEVLAMQLLILLQGALAEELRAPQSQALSNAAEAAEAVIAQACRKELKKTVRQWSLAASLAVAFSGVLLWQYVPASQPVKHLALAAPAGASSLPSGLNPVDMEAVLNLQEQFNRGACPAPQLISLPPGQVTAYMNAVNFRKPDNPEAERANLHAFLTWYQTARAGECFYAPVNGHTLVKWSS